MYYVEDIKKWSIQIDSGNPEDGYKLSRPKPDVFINRLKDAWKVLIGEADAIKWYRQ